MRVYRTEAGAWAGTQADARALALDTGGDAKSWEEIEVPIDKAGLLAWLNDNVGPAAAEAAKAERELDRLREIEATRIEQAELGRPDGLIRPVAPAPNAPRPSLALDAGKVSLDRSIKIDELIQSATLPETISLFDQVAWRLDEHRRAIVNASAAA